MKRLDDEGSVLLLTIGYAVLALVLVLVCVNATSLYLAQKRLDAVADAAALAAADGFTLTVVGGEARADLSAAELRDQAQEIIDVMGEATLVSASSPDGVSARVSLSATWHPPILTMFVPAGIELGATATSRNALR
ncbi:pilus assembly protein TadG-related protein [Microbacterium sp. RD1]|uniref:pilus assembly protein TadG-related protein n=1 Tax=Microbacterium sp. RD1 TaxID=3457313 RepID=UPI003FA562C5